MKKLKPSKAIVKPPNEVQQPSAPTSTQKAESKVWAVIKVAGGVGTVLGLIYTILHLWPQITVEPTAAADSSNPLSGYFRITNEQGYSLTDVSIDASLRCAKIGLGSNTEPIDNCMPSMHVQTHRWTKHTLEGHEPYEITPGERIFVTPGALLYAQLSIFISYQPWILPIHLSEKEFRFETRRLSDGKIEWLHIPADAEGENTGKEKLMHTILTWAGALVAIGAAIFWVISATVWVPSVGTAGWGALTGGFLVVPGPKKERIDLVETLRRQWGWNKWAAIATATAAVLTAGASLF